MPINFHPFSKLTQSWSDGKLLTLLVNSVVPGLCPGGQEAHPDNGVMFLERAMDRAEAWLGVPQGAFQYSLQIIT